MVNLEDFTVLVCENKVAPSTKGMYYETIFFYRTQKFNSTAHWRNEIDNIHCVDGTTQKCESLAKLRRERSTKEKITKALTLRCHSQIIKIVPRRIVREHIGKVRGADDIY